MIEPQVKPRHDFTPATNKTAYLNADLIAQEAFETIIHINGLPHVAHRMHKIFFNNAVNGAEYLQKFMNSRIDKSTQ